MEDEETVAQKAYREFFEDLHDWLREQFHGQPLFKKVDEGELREYCGYKHVLAFKFFDHPVWLAFRQEERDPDIKSFALEFPDMDINESAPDIPPGERSAKSLRRIAWGQGDEYARLDETPTRDVLRCWAVHAVWFAWKVLGAEVFA